MIGASDTPACCGVSMTDSTVKELRVRPGLIVFPEPPTESLENKGKMGVVNKGMPIYNQMSGQRVNRSKGKQGIFRKMKKGEGIQLELVERME